MTIYVLDVASYQQGLTIPQVKAAGFHAVNLKISHGLTQKSVIADVVGWATRARAAGLGLSTFHWLDNSASGVAQANYAWSRIKAIGGPKGVAHVVDAESSTAPPTQAQWTDYMETMTKHLGRTVTIYTGDWWWTARKWPGSSRTPLLWAAPNAGYLGTYPGDASPHWNAGYGGWPELAVMQYGVGKLPGGVIDVSKSAIRHPWVWAAMTGGDVLVGPPDPGNSPPEAWTIPMTAAEIAVVRSNLLEDRPERRAAMVAEFPVIDDPDTLPILPAGAGEVCAPVIAAEMADWLALGGGNSGCVGNAAHKTGFHRGSAFIPASDYSRVRDPNGSDGPYTNGNYACAGDFAHGGKAKLRAIHADVLDRLMDNDPSLSMVCEMIVQPIAGQPVRYWARWAGTGTLRTYTGVGHDTWSHISIYRSRANQRPRLWATQAEDDDMPTTPAQFLTLLKDPDITAYFRATPLQYTGGGIPTGMSILGVYAELLATSRALAKRDGVTPAELEAAKAEIEREMAAIEARNVTRDAETVAALLAKVGGATPGTPIQQEQLVAAVREVYGEAVVRAAEAVHRG